MDQSLLSMQSNGDQPIIDDEVPGEEPGELRPDLELRGQAISRSTSVAATPREVCVRTQLVVSWL